VMLKLVWYALSATRGHKFTPVCYTLTPFLEHLPNYEIIHAHATENYSMHCLESVFGDRMISRKLWHSYLLDLNLCNFFIVEHVKGQLGRKYLGCSVCSFTSRNSTRSEL